MYDHVSKELANCDIEHYLDSTDYFKFKEPFHLRAQNSHNRTGYGWDWDWSYGVGSYTEGTFYGETTDYIFSGVYLSTYWFYEPQRRHNTSTPPKTINICVHGLSTGIYKLIPYQEKLEDVITGPTVPRFICIPNAQHQPVYLNVHLCQATREIFIPHILLERYKDTFLSQAKFNILKDIATPKECATTPPQNKQKKKRDIKAKSANSKDTNTCWRCGAPCYGGTHYCFEHLKENNEY